MKSNNFDDIEINEIFEIALIALSNFKNEIGDELDLNEEYLITLKGKLHQFLNN